MSVAGAAEKCPLSLLYSARAASRGEIVTEILLLFEVFLDSFWMSLFLFVVWDVTFFGSVWMYILIVNVNIHKFCILKSTIHFHATVRTVFFFFFF